MPVTLRAQCESCATSVDVAADDLFGFDTACPRCSGVLLILDEDDAEEQAAEPAAALDGPYEDVPTRVDADDAPGSPFATPRPAARSPLEVDPSFYDRPTKADSEEDPYVAAAAALDSTVTGKRTRPSSGRLRRPAEEPRPRPSSGRLQRVEGSGRARLIHGTHTGAPPLPAWDDLDALSAAARAEPSSVSAPPLADGLQGDDGSGELEELAPVVEVPATAGRGSRTYDHPGSSEVGSSLDPAPSAGTPATTPRPSARARRAGSSTRIPRPRGTGPHARPPTGGRLFGEDLDWLALIDDNLPELDIPDDTGAPRVLVRLPETAAPTADADAAQIDRFKTAVTALEQGGSTAIAELLGAPAAQVARAESRQATRFSAGTEDPPSMSPVTPQGPADDDSATTRPLGKAKTDDPATRPLPKPDEDDTRAWEERERRAAADATARKHPSGRGAPAGGGEGRRVVEEFRHADLDPALVCARDAASVEADDFRQLYQRIFHPPGDREAPRVILVTSPDPGAGKTAVAANLAIVAARTPGRSAVLVDADPRGRGVLRSFGLRQRMEGLLEALQTHQDPARSVVQFALGNLDVVPLGIPGSDAAELVASERMASFLARTREAFPTSVVIVDGSSVLHAADPLVLARNVDGVVLVVRAGQTPREEVKRAVELLGPGRVLGVVLNGAAA